MSSLGDPHILADQLTLSQPWETDYAHLFSYYWHPRIFRHTDDPVIQCILEMQRNGRDSPGIIEPLVKLDNVIIFQRRSRYISEMTNPD